jgi:hypothetical protein
MNLQMTQTLRTPEGDSGAGGGGLTEAQTVNMNNPSVAEAFGGDEAGGASRGSSESGTSGPRSTEQAPDTGSKTPAGAPAKGATSAPAAASVASATAPNIIGMSEAQLQQLAAKMVGAIPKQAPVAAAPKVPTPQEQAEFEKHFGIVRLNKENFKSIMGFDAQNPDQIKQLEATLHQASRQATLMANYQTQQLLQEQENRLRAEFQQQVGPVIQAHQAAQSAAIEDAFYKGAEDLRDYKELVQSVAHFEMSKGTKFKSIEEANKFVAERVRGLLTKAAPSGNQTSSGPTAQTTQRKFSMPTTSMAGRPGSSSSAAKPASGPQEIFGDKDND